MPETSRMGPEMRKAGATAKSEFEQGFNSGTSPEALGSNFTGKLQQTIAKGMQSWELPFGASKYLDQFSSDIDTKLVAKLQGDATRALQNYSKEYDNLSAAQQRSSKAEADLNLARDNGINKASVVLPLIQEQAKAHNELATQTTKTGAAYDDYNEKTTKLTAATGEAAKGGEILAGVMGGLVVAGAQALTGAIESVYESMIHGVIETFQTGIEVTKELAEKSVELGEKYENIGIQIHEFSNASGESFDKLEKSAQSVFSTLDVAGADTGKTMAQLATILNTPADTIETLGRHVIELQGRFSNLKATDLGAIFVAFKTPAQETDSVLASLAQSARGAGQGLGDLTSALSGDAAITLAEAGMSIKQAGAFTADLLKMGAAGRPVMMGLQAAMKEFGKEGLSFGEGMQLAGQRLKELGDTAAGQDLAETLFGTRRWTVAMKAVQDYVDVMGAAPATFDASTQSLEQFLASTETMENKWELVKHRVEDAFKPLGAAALGLVGKGLDALVGGVNTHMDQIKHAVQIGGAYIIQIAADLEQFAIGVLNFFAPVADGVTTFLGTMIEGVAGFLGGIGQMIQFIPGMGDLGKNLVNASQAAFDMGHKLSDLKVGDGMHDIANWLEQHQINVGDATQKWTDYWTEASGQNAPPMVGGAASGGQSTLGAVAPGGPPIGPGGSLPGGAPSGFSVGSGAAATDSSQKVMAQTIFAAVKSAGYSDQTAITAVAAAMKESSLDPNNPNNPNHFGLFQETADKPHGSVGEQIRWFINALNALGGPKVVDGNPADFIAGKGVEDGGYSGSAFDVAGARKILGMQKGGYPITTGSGNGDDVPALLGKGEYVWDTDTMSKWGWLISSLHNGDIKQFGQGGDVGGVSQVIWSDLEDPTVQAAHGDAGIGVLHGAPASGGPGSTYSDETNAGGQGFSGHHGHVHTTFNRDPFTGAPYNQVPAGTNTAAGEWSAFPPWVKQLGDMYGLDAKTYAGHQEWDGANHGIDWYPRGKQDMSGQSYTHQDNQTLNNFANAAIAVGTGQMQGFQGGLGSSTLPDVGSGPGSIPRGSKGMPGLPGLPGQYGGYGAYGGETADQAYQAQQAVQSAKDTASNQDWDIQQHQKKIDDLKKQIADVNAPTMGKLGVMVPPDPSKQAERDKKTQTLQNELDIATHELTVSQRSRSEQDGKIAEAERKQQEDMYKSPKGLTAQPVTGEKEFQTLGSGLLKGLGQEIGLGDVFKKSPLDWGIVKLLGGFANWGLSTANAWADEIGAGHTGMTGGQPIPGWDQPGGGGANLISGLASSFGVRVPKNITNPPQYPNQVATQPPGPFGAPTGPAPGPPNIYNDNSINVSSDVSDTKVLGPIQEQANASNGASFTNSSGFQPQ